MSTFNFLQSIYNNQINSILADSGLTTSCTLVFGISKKDICPNCIFDAQSNKSSNTYKPGGQYPFSNNRICPYCHGSGFYGEQISEENVFLAVIWESKKWLNIQIPSINSPNDYVQTICHESLLNKLQSTNYIIIKNQKFQLDGKPSYSGLGDNNYLITMWKKI